MNPNNTQHKSFFRHLISHCDLHPASGREHHVSDYLLAGIEGSGYKDQIGLLPTHHDDSGCAVATVIMGNIADTTGYMAIAFLIPMVCYGVIGGYALSNCSVSSWAKK